MVPPKPYLGNLSYLIILSCIVHMQYLIPHALHVPANLNYALLA